MKKVVEKVLMYALEVLLNYFKKKYDTDKHIDTIEKIYEKK